MIHKNLLEFLKKQCSEGNFSLLETVIMNIHERSLIMALPKNIKNLLLKDLKGQDCYIVRFVNGIENIEEKFIDFMDAMVFFTKTEEELLPGEKLELVRGEITSGDISYFEYIQTSLLKTTIGSEYVPHEAPKA